MATVDLHLDTPYERAIKDWCVYMPDQEGFNEDELEDICDGCVFAEMNDCPYGKPKKFKLDSSMRSRDEV